MNKIPLDSIDFQILTIVANSGKPISSWEICKKLFPCEKNAQTHLSSVIWRLKKLTKVQAVTKRPHPMRRKKVIYDSPNVPFSVDGIVFIPSDLGGLIVSCKYAGNCNPCRLDSQKCKMPNFVRRANHELIQDSDDNG